MTFSIHLFLDAQRQFKSEPSSHDPSFPSIVIGDLRGQIFDLARLLIQFGYPDHQTFRFLGDLVDRGEFSVDTLTLLFLLKRAYPNNVFVIRSNQGFDDTDSQSGSNSEVLSVFGTAAPSNCAAAAFNCLPMTALIDGCVRCVHGKIGPAGNFH
jgi:hypothetical protein